VKKIFYAGLFFICAGVHAAPLVTQTPIRSVGETFCVDASTEVWTAIPPDGNASGRAGIIVRTDSNAAQDIVGVFTNSSSTPTLATGGYEDLEVWTVQIPDDVNTFENEYFEIADTVFFWVLSQAGSPNGVCGVEYFR
jgi:hypothetical protein